MGIKKPGDARFWELCWRSGAGVSGGVGEIGLGRLKITQGLTYDLLGKTGTFTALRADAGCGAHFSVAAATFINRFTNMTVGNTLAKTDVHIELPVEVV